MGEQLMEAQRRITGHSNGHPLLGLLCELLAAAHLELGEHHQAVTGFRRAQEFYATSHRGPPDPGYELRCYQQQMKLTTGPLGAMPPRLSKLPSKLTRSPSLPSLAEGDGDD